ncbi:MAG: hypothetical protein A2Y07_00960 [Planctomycetes bacterium GWF2_50_10]|nr:MAG: hypothetical protein A2Y07_00960 [Planctomycetes bacterium GWF2_50_10]
MGLVTVGRYYGEWEARGAKEELDMEGIRSVIVGDNLPAAVGELPAVALIELQVNEEDVPRARAILKSPRE